jgi:hypothetical protein
MKKTLFALICVVGMISACRKESIQGPPVTPPIVKSHLAFEADPSSPDRSVQAPSSLTLKTLLKVGSVKGGVLKGGWVTFDSKGAFRPDRDIKNFFMRIKDQSTTPATILYTSPVYTSVAAVSTLPQMSVNIAETKTYNVEFNFDVLSTATDSLILGIGLYYSHRDAAFDTVKAIVQRIAFATNPSSTMSAALSASTIATSNVIDNQEVPLITTSFNAVGGVSTINKIIYKFADPLVSPVVSMLRMYDGTTLLTSANVSGGLFTFSQNINVPISKEVTIKAVVVSVDETTSGRSFKLIQDRFEYTDVGGNAKFDDGDIVGKDQYVFAAIPVLARSGVTAGPLVDSTVRDLFSHTVSSTRTMGVKTFCYKITLNDPNNNDTLLLKNIAFLEGNVDVTSQYLITKQNGLVDSIFTENDTELFFTKISGNGESVVVGGVPKVFVFRAKLIGFNDPLKTDNLSVEVLGDVVTPPFDYRNVNTGGTSSPSRLFNSNSPSTSALVVHFMYSDHSAVPHSSASGISTPDHFSGAATGKPVFTGISENFFYQ